MTTATWQHCKSGERHRERPHMKSRSFLTDGLENFKSIGVP
jgi:hypothetical protein